MKIKIKKYWYLIVLSIVLSLALFLRVYKLSEVPASLSWDEAAVGYNGYTIANYGRDEYGKFLPLTFRSFGDDKSPVHVYMTALVIKVIGLSDFSVRLAPAIFGVLSVWIMFVLLNELYDNKILGLIGSALLAISPYNLQFSRFNHEAVFALFFFLFGLWLWFKARRDNFWLPFSIFSFGLSLLSYHSSKFVVPITVLLLTCAYFKEIFRRRFFAVVSLLIILCIGLLYWFNPDLLGFARAKQTTIPISEIEKMPIFVDVASGKTWFPSEKAELVTRIWLTWQRYIVFFQPDFLYLKGDSNFRFSTQVVGQFYRIDVVFLLIGGAYLVLRRDKKSLIIIILALVSPIPAAITGGMSEIGHSGRSLFIMGTWVIVESVGLYQFVKYFRPKYLAILVSIGVSMIYLGSFSQYVKAYYTDYPAKSAIEWQYGMKQIVEYIDSHPEFSTVYMTEIRSQPYIFFLMHLKYNLWDYLREVEFNTTESKSHNTVSSFGKYHFGDWDQIQSMPYPGVLYVVEPSMYSGLAHKADFEVKKLVKYPNGSDAYFMVSAKQ